MRIAFAGNPNSGKTTMYNALLLANVKITKAQTFLLWGELVD